MFFRVHFQVFLKLSFSGSFWSLLLKFFLQLFFGFLEGLFKSVF